MKKKKLQPDEGLTLVETLVAISVLLMAVVVPMVIYSQSIANTRYAGNRITAYYLAQEGIEFVKYVINTNFNGGTSWIDPDLSKCRGADKCTVDVTNNAVASCGNSCNNIRINNSDLYNYIIGGTPTIFKREIEIKDNNSFEVVVTATVSWVDAGFSKSLVIQENMFEWR